MIINPQEFKWTGATKRTNGVPYPPSERKGYELAIRLKGSTDWKVVLGVISNNNDYVAPIGDLANPLNYGNYEAVVRDVDINDLKSDWSTTLEFSILAAPEAPVNFTIS